MNDDYLEPDTARSDQSIWRDISCKALERTTMALFKKQHVAGRRIYAMPFQRAYDPSYWLPLDVEMGLADDFAFIAACEPQVGFVTAVAIEQGGNEPSVLVKLAANEGISVSVRENFDQLFEVLRQIARREITQESCREQLFGLIIRLNCNKILGRLGSIWFKPPAHLKKFREPLPVRLRTLTRSKFQSESPRCDRADLGRLARQIGSFEMTFKNLENGTREEVASNLGDVVKQAFSMTEDGVKLPGRLKALGYSEPRLDTRDVREVGKVANYPAA